MGLLTGKNTMKTMNTLIAAAFAATTLIPAAAMAANDDPQPMGYVSDSRGNAVMSGSGLCWRHAGADLNEVNQPCDVAPKPMAALVPKQAPAPVAAAPAPAPTMTQKFSFSGDALFAFDKSVLKPEGKAMLDGLVHQLAGVKYGTILATGHTDRFGSNGYNQKLSERRAQAVKDYLVSNDLRADRIEAAGKGEMQPATATGACPGAKSASVVACLQPDRRVDIEVTGTTSVTASR